MGVFTVGRQVALEIDMPGWWLANASVDMDFRRGIYYDSSTANPRTAANFLSCSRASIGYAKTAAGTLTQFGNDMLRITDLGLLVENTRTNYLLQSEDFATTWSTDSPGVSAIVTVNQAVDPNGTTTMDQVSDGTANSRHIMYLQISTGLTANINRTFSVFVKDLDRRYVALEIVEGGGNYIFCYADLQTGTITDSGIGNAGAGTIFTSATIEPFTNGIYRISLTGIPNNTATGFYHMISLSDRNTEAGGPIGGQNPSYAGSNKSIYLWGAQSEEAVFSTSYIPTTTAAATRAADNITTSGSLQTVINAATASLVAQTDNGAISSVAANIVDSNGTNLLGFDATNHALASIIATLATGNTANRTTQDKLGLAWSGAGRSLVLNNGTVVTDASAQTPSATQHIGSSGTANFAYAYIERVTAWTSKLADATLQAFTAP